jgi:hypothetical protein
VAVLHSPPPPTISHADDDVSEDLATENARTALRYNETIDELSQLAKTARSQWSPDRQQTFDARVTKLRGEIASAKGRQRQRAQGELVRYLQGAAVRDQVTVAMNDRGAP